MVVLVDGWCGFVNCMVVELFVMLVGEVELEILVGVLWGLVGWVLNWDEVRVFVVGVFGLVKIIVEWCILVWCF